jgi:Phasin protein
MQIEMIQIMSSCRVLGSERGVANDAAKEAEETTMSEQIVGFGGIPSQEEALQMAAPLQTAWRKSCIDLPLTVLSETLHFFGQRLEAQSQLVASLTSCKSMPEMIEVQSQFMRTAVNDYGSETSKIMGDVRSTMNKAA